MELWGNYANANWSRKKLDNKGHTFKIFPWSFLKIISIIIIVIIIIKSSHANFSGMWKDRL